MRLLLDEMCPEALADQLRQAGIDTVTVAQLRLTGAPDTDVFTVARGGGRAVLTEHVGDFTRLAADLILAGGHHSGLLVALS